MIEQITQKTTYIAVGFKTNQQHSLFYIKEHYIEDFYTKLKIQTIKHNPDIISIRIVKENKGG